MEEALLWIAEYSALVVLGLVVAAMLVLHLRLRNARTFSTLISGVAGVAWLFFGDALLRYVMPPAPLTATDVEALVALGRENQVHGIVAAILFLWFGFSFLLSALSCPRSSKHAV